MNTTFSRILAAQLVVVALALMVAAVITRVSLHRGFEGFLERQETTVLQNLAPAMSRFYERRGGWSSLRENPAAWQNIWRAGMLDGNEPGGFRGPPGSRPRQDPGQAPPPRPGPDVAWAGRPGRGALRERLFLLDVNKERLAGAPIEDIDDALLEAIVVDGETVAWIGFAPAGDFLPPEANRFLAGQLKILALSAAIALVVAVLLAWALARTVSRPVQAIGDSVRRISEGKYDTRAKVGAGGELATLANHVNQLAVSLDANRTARRRWMADIAHELRTPVAVMKGEIEAMVDGVREPDEASLSSLREEADHLAMMVDDLQTLALSDAGALAIRKEAVDVSMLVDQAAEAFGPRFAARGIRLEVEATGDTELSCDPQRVRQLLHNLLENSARYSVSGGTVRLSLVREDGVKLVLEDSGPGVRDEQLGRLFERFYRAEGSRSRASGGSGLGLSICRNIVEAHGGAIVADHGSMGGLRISVTLPG